MAKKYSYLTDPRALDEIRRHQWLESQKAQREIGFASAAVDWIKNYGEAWKKIHVKEADDWRVFFERRRFRRFKLDAPITLIKNSMSFVAETTDISFLGVLCKSKKFFSLGNELAIDATLDEQKACRLACAGAVGRFLPLSSDEYALFLKFDQNGQQQIEQCSRNGLLFR